MKTKQKMILIFLHIKIMTFHSYNSNLFHKLIRFFIFSTSKQKHHYNLSELRLKWIYGKNCDHNNIRGNWFSYIINIIRWRVGIGEDIRCSGGSLMNSCCSLGQRIFHSPCNHLRDHARRARVHMSCRRSSPLGTKGIPHRSKVVSKTRS